MHRRYGAFAIGAAAFVLAQVAATQAQPDSQHGSTYSTRALHAEGHVALQIERDAILTGSDAPTTQHRTPETLPVESQVARFETPPGVEQQHLVGGLAIVLLGWVLVIVRPRSRSSRTAPRQRLLKALRAWQHRRGVAVVPRGRDAS